jgi:RNA polymerase sigma-70 factor (ECF subfamily)
MTTSPDTEPELARYRGYLYVLARVRLATGLRGKLDPSDLVQQTLLKAHQASDRWRELDDDARAAWLRQILANTIVDEIRRYGRSKRDAALERSLLASVDESSVRLEAALEADQTSPSQQLIRQEQLLALGEALQALPEDQRRVIELHHLDGLSLADVARRLGRSQASVAGLLRRGLRTLIERLKRE